MHSLETIHRLNAEAIDLHVIDTLARKQQLQAAMNAAIPQKPEALKLATSEVESDIR